MYLSDFVKVYVVCCMLASALAFGGFSFMCVKWHDCIAYNIINWYTSNKVVLLYTGNEQLHTGSHTHSVAPRTKTTMTPDAWAEKFESLERINSICETNRSFDSCKSCKQPVPSRLRELHESQLPFVSRIEYIRSTLSIFFCSCIQNL